MLNDAQVREHVLRTESLLDKVESLEDEQARLIAVQAAQALMTLYGEALARIVSHAQGQNGAGDAMLQAMAGDELVSHLLLLHDLHPVPLEQRVSQALDQLEAYLTSQGTAAELVAVQEGVAHVHLTANGCSGCASSAVKTKVEKAVLQVAPELLRVQLADGAAASAATNFIPLGALTPVPGND